MGWLVCRIRFIRVDVPTSESSMPHMQVLLSCQFKLKWKADVWALKCGMLVEKRRFTRHAWATFSSFTSRLISVICGILHWHESYGMLGTLEWLLWKADKVINNYWQVMQTVYPTNISALNVRMYKLSAWAKSVCKFIVVSMSTWITAPGPYNWRSALTFVKFRKMLSQPSPNHKSLSFCKIRIVTYSDLCQRRRR